MNAMETLYARKGDGYLLYVFNNIFNDKITVRIMVYQYSVYL